MIYVSAQPDENYFIWQLKAQMVNLMDLNFPGEYHMLVKSSPQQVNPAFLQFIDTHASDRFKFFLYEEHVPVDYPAAIKPLLVSKYLDTFPGEEFFLIDSDVIFRELPDFEGMTTGCYASATGSYIGATYLLNKDERLFRDMCAVVGIDPQEVISREADSGGGQYLIRHTSALFWEKVYQDAVILYRLMKNAETYYVYKHHGDSPAQSWCAEMWATLWNLWLVGDCRTHPELDFCWPGDPVERWHQTKILHNAGVTPDMSSYLFCKSNYIQQSPVGVATDYVSPAYCSKQYAEILKRIKYL